MVAAASAFGQDAATPLQPFTSDENTLLLYHFNEGEGDVVADSGPHGYDGDLDGAAWVTGRFGNALRFDGEDDHVYRETPDAIQGIKQITVECWLNQDRTDGRRFMAGQDVGFHFEVDGGVATSISIYNEGGGVPNADGLPHQQISTSLGSIRPGRWHHNAITYDGEMVSFFFDGVLRDRRPSARDFALGAPSRGLWIGCYVGTDYWFSGSIDEFRVSDCIRYDPDRDLAVGDTIFDMPQPETLPPPSVRVPNETGLAKLRVTLRKLYGGEANGWVCLKPPGAPAVTVGEYALAGLGPGEEATTEVDVSDEVAGDGEYVLGLVPDAGDGYFAVTEAMLAKGDRVVAKWSGDLRSRRTFSPTLLLPLWVGEDTATPSARIVLLPGDRDRHSGQLSVVDDDPAWPPILTGDGHAEWWLNAPNDTTYRVHMRYGTSGFRPCDIVIDGNDLNAFDMCAVNVSDRTHPGDAFWEYQGSVRLAAGPHWLRVQDVLPDIVALRLEPTDEGAATGDVPWGRFAEPDGDFLAQPAEWSTEPRFGRIERASASTGEHRLEFATRFANTDPDELFAGDRVRFARRGKWDLEPFGRLRFQFQGHGSGHVVALWLVDVKGDENLLWRVRDTQTEPTDVTVPISFEGNDVFDPGRTVAVCFDLDEGNERAENANDLNVTIADLQFDRRDNVVEPEGYADALAVARAALALVAPPAKTPRLLSSGFRPWTEPVVPEMRPQFVEARPPPVTRETLGHALHFAGARGVAAATLDDFHASYDFGDVCWPHIGILPQRRNFGSDADYERALGELETRLEDVRARGLLLWDIWGYVPNDEAGATPQVTPEHHAILLRVFRDRFLGYDNGEQDGRYIGGYADRDAHTNRVEGWEAFVRWDEAICRDSMNFMNATGSLNFSHYYGERGARTLGLETAQGLPSDTLLFAFLRGASKEYGRLTTQATSIWNRYGYNMYNDRRTTAGSGYGLGPNKGCSLSLHKRLFMASYTGGDSIVGSETSQFTADRLESGAPELSPLGEQHIAVKEWVERHPDRGILYTPAAFMLDFHHGWNPPRHLYRADKYKIWGKLAYEKGDYLIDAMFRFVWPGYEDCSYLRNERGFITPTPFGDMFDVITNRCDPDVLKQYSAIMLLGDVQLSPDVVERLTRFVEAGGDLLLDATQAREFGEATGASLGDTATGYTSRLLSDDDSSSELSYTYTVLTPTSATPLLVNEAAHALLAVNQVGEGRVIVGAVDHWMTDQITYETPEIINMEPPYRMLDGLRAALGEYFDSFSPVDVTPEGLNVRVNCFADDPQWMLVTLTNSDLFADWEGEVALRAGRVTSARELWSDRELRADGGLRLTVSAGDVAVVDLRLANR